jgi:cell division protein FtsN
VAKPTAQTPLAPPAIKPADTKASGKAGSVQLGAFSSEEKANAVWAGLAGKYGLSGKRIIAVESGGKTLYRLRAVSGDPAATCTKLKAAGDACAIVE